MASLKGNRKIAKRRGKTWRNKLVKGKREAKLKPSNLYLLRTEQGFSQSDIANSLGISLATYGAIERGKRPAKLGIMKELSDKFEASYKDLFTLSKTGGKGVAIIRSR